VQADRGTRRGGLRERAPAPARAPGRATAARRDRRSGRVPGRRRRSARLAGSAVARRIAARGGARVRGQHRRPRAVTLRANTGRVTRDQLATALASERAGALLAPSEVAPDALDARRLDAPASTQAWREGLFAIADAGAQIAVELCGAAAGERILDACAGNGGKTAHLLRSPAIARASTRSTSPPTRWVPRAPRSGASG
jgi:hypothetical protein